MKTNSHPVDEESSIRYSGWGVLAAAFTGVMVSFAPIVPYTFSLFLDPLHAAFGWKREAMGGAFALAAITVAIVSPLIGILLDRFPPRRIILPGILVFAVGLAALSRLTPNIVQFYATFFVIGLVANATAQFAYTRTVLTWFTSHRGFALALLLTGVFVVVYSRQSHLLTGIVAFVLAFIALIAMRFTARRSAPATVALLAAFGLLIGVAVAPTVAYYGSMDPRALWEAGGATALFVLAFGSAGYATRRDLTALARICFWALCALIVAGLVAVFVNIPGAALAYSVLGLIIFAGFTMFDFQRLRRSQDVTSAPLLAASIFLDVLNVFLFFLEIFGGAEETGGRA